MIAQDNINVNETLYLQPSSSAFNFTESYVMPTLYSSVVGNTIHYYTNFQGIDTVWINNLVVNSSGVGGQQQVALRYCWTTDCDDVFLTEFEMNYMAFSTACGTDTVYKTSLVSINPPVGEVKPVANVFTPNGDGVNDLFKLAGTNDPCYDVMEAIIINRWGVKVFESIDPLFQWDGKNKGKQDCAEGVYFLIINGTYGSTYDPISGNRIPNEVNSRHTIQLIRD
jgi:gliding motility-associated-like protein